MAQRTFNKNNWTGEDATITFNKNGTFTLNGDNFVIIRTTEKSDDFENQVSKVYRANPAAFCAPINATKSPWHRCFSTSSDPHPTRAQRPAPRI